MLKFKLMLKTKKMIIYNVTINIHESVHNQWLTWMQTKHIPEILATKKFSSARIVKVLIEEEMGGTTYSIQYTTDSITFRTELYYKDYKQLTSFTPVLNAQNYSNYNPFTFIPDTLNAGSGYAQGIEFFWRDKEEVIVLDSNSSR